MVCELDRVDEGVQVDEPVRDCEPVDACVGVACCDVVAVCERVGAADEESVAVRVGESVGMPVPLPLLVGLRVASDEAVQD